MDRVLEIDRDRGRIRVEAGITLRSLSERLTTEGLALENLGDIVVQSLAGATATGTHGTGARLKNLSASVMGLRIVTGAGEERVIDGTDPESLAAARVNLGALGVVTEMTLKVVPAFVLQGVDRPEPLDDVLANLESSVETNDHFEFFAFPHSPLALTRTNNRTGDQARPRPRLRAWVEDELLPNHALGLLMRLGRRVPVTIPTIDRMIPKVAGTTRRTDVSYRVFASSRKVRFTEMEYGVPREHAVEAVRRVHDIASRKGSDVSFPIEVRFVAADDAFLSPSSGRDTCYVAVHTYRGMEWEPYFRAVEEALSDYDARPHWGKRHLLDAGQLGKLYPDWDRFAAVRDQLDPERRFANAFTTRMLGP